MIFLRSMIYHDLINTLQKKSNHNSEYHFQTQEPRCSLMNVCVTFGALQNTRPLAGVPCLGLETGLFVDAKKREVGGR